MRFRLFAFLFGTFRATGWTPGLNIMFHRLRRGDPEMINLPRFDPAGDGKLAQIFGIETKILRSSSERNNIVRIDKLCHATTLSSK